MWLLRSIGNALFSSRTPVQISSGRLTRVDGAIRLIFTDAQLLWQQSEVEFESEVVLTRIVSSEDEVQPGEEVEVRLPLSQMIRYSRRLDAATGSTIYVFSMADGRILQYNARDINTQTADLVDMTLLTALYETTYRQRADTVQDEKVFTRLRDVDLRTITQGSVASQPAPFSSPAPARTTASAAASPVAPARAAAPAAASPAAAAPKQPAPSTLSPYTVVRPLPSTATEIARVDCALYVVNPEVGSYVKMSDAIARVYEADGVHIFLHISRPTGEVLICERVDTNLNVNVSRNPSSLSFNLSDGVRVSAWRLYSADNDAMTAFTHAFADAVLQTTMRANKLSEADTEYVRQGLDAMDVDYVSSTDDEADDEDDDEEEDEDEEDDNGSNFGSRARFEGAASSAQKNSDLVMAHTHHRALVFRGGQVGVFAQGDDGKLHFSTAIKKLETPKKTGTLAPSKSIMYDHDSSLVFMDRGVDDKLYKLDIERGTVVEEWSLPEYMSATSIAPEHKMAQLGGTKTFVGTTSNSLFQIDPRLQGKRGNVVNEDLMKQYSSKTNFRVAATTANGEVVIGSESGDLRLYDKLNKQAKSHLPGFGHTIVGVDVTADGRYVLATFNDYLLLIDASLKSEPDKTGFKKSLKSSNVQPIMLKLRPEDVARLGCPVKFTPARFDVGDSDERRIVTSCGPNVIVWNLRRVLNGSKDQYKIGQYTDTVVADQFFYNQGNRVVVAMRDDVDVASTRKLAPARKASMEE